MSAACRLCSYCDLSDSGGLNCASCRYQRLEVSEDLIYTESVRPLTYCCAIVLPLGYALGLFYVLYTHNMTEVNRELVVTPASLAEKVEGSAQADDDAMFTPRTGDDDADRYNKASEIITGDHQDNFTIALCALLMLLTVMALSFTSWALVHMLTAADWEIEGKHSFFPAHTVVFVITSSLVFTAVVLATTGHVATCIDIANGAAIQLSMVTMPLLIVLGTIMSDEDNAAFTLVFSTLSLTGVVCATIVLNYVTLSGRTDTLAGVVMVMVFLLWLVMYAHVPSHEEYLLPKKYEDEALRDAARDAGRR